MNLINEIAEIVAEYNAYNPTSPQLTYVPTNEWGLTSEVVYPCIAAHYETSSIDLENETKSYQLFILGLDRMELPPPREENEDIVLYNLGIANERRDKQEFFKSIIATIVKRLQSPNLQYGYDIVDKITFEHWEDATEWYLVGVEGSCLISVTSERFDCPFVFPEPA